MTNNQTSPYTATNGTPLRQCDLLVIGAGPAGLAAATVAAQAGVDTLLLDEQAAPGGQIYRAITQPPTENRSILGSDYWAGESLIGPFEQSGAHYQPSATVWAITQKNSQDPDSRFEAACSINGTAELVRARQLLLATGAQERPVPIPGWTLPGVITAGAGQILLKASGMVPTGHIVLAGCGPLLYLIAWQYLNAGVKIDALLETTQSSNLKRALPHALAFMLSPYFAKGIKLMREVKQRVRIIKNVSDLRAEGDDSLETVRYTAGGKTHAMPADMLLLHQGVVPNINLARALGLEHAWNSLLDCWEPVVDTWGTSSIPDIWLAGDGAGIGGAIAAENRGRIAALQAAHRLGRVTAPDRDAKAKPLRHALRKALGGRDFFDTLYQAPPSFRRPTGDTIVCRCEEITAAQIRDTVKLGCTGPNQMKSFLRCGMGPCQGRFCGLTVTEIIGDELGIPPRDVGYYRLRFPIKPLTLGELASLPQTDASIEAVVRLKK